MHGIHNVEEILDLQTIDIHRGCCIAEVNLHTLIGDAYRPKQATWSYTGVEVVDLVLRSNLPLIEIHSDEAKGPAVLFPIHSDVGPLHKPVVYGEEKRSAGTGVRVDPPPGTLEIRQADEAVKISDLRRLVDTSGDGGEVVDKRSKDHNPSRNGFWSGIMPLGLRQCWHPES